MRTLISAAVLLSTTQAWAADEYVLEADHTYAYFKVEHMSRGYLTGVFKDVTGTMMIDGDKVESVSVDIDVASVDTFNAKRDAHLKSPDYFNAKRYRKMTFRSRDVRSLGGGRYKITGDLTIRGQRRRITAE
ncbi:MAG: YceI family protein, partial [Myxococcota bacterium]